MFGGRACSGWMAGLGSDGSGMVQRSRGHLIWMCCLRKLVDMSELFKWNLAIMASIFSVIFIILGAFLMEIALNYSLSWMGCSSLRYFPHIIMGLHLGSNRGNGSRRWIRGFPMMRHRNHLCIILPRFGLSDPSSGLSSHRVHENKIPFEDEIRYIYIYRYSQFSYVECLFACFRWSSLRSPIRQSLSVMLLLLFDSAVH